MKIKHFLIEFIEKQEKLDAAPDFDPAEWVKTFLLILNS